MFTTNLIQIIRALKNNKFFSIINITGLSVGIACSILIFIWAQDEYNYDKFHKNYNRIYAVYEIQSYTSGYKLYTYSTPAPLAAALKDKYPEIEYASRFTIMNLVMRYKDNLYNENRVGMADSVFFEIFSFDFIQGNPKTCLKDKNSIILTEKVATKYFGNDDPVGKTILINNKFNFIVTAVIKDLPKNSRFEFNTIINFNTLKDLSTQEVGDWGWNSFQTFVLLKDKTDYLSFQKKIINIVKDNLKGTVTDIYLFPFSKMHLYSPSPNEFEFITLVKILVGIGIFILIIACINFMNLSTARSANRAKEVGIKKVTGASRKSLIIRFLSESILIAFISGIFAIFLADLFLPVFNQLSDKVLILNVFDKTFLFGFIGIVLFVGIISGIYPAFYLSKFNPISVLKGNLKKGAKGAMFRKIMVIFQFSLAIILCVSALFLYKQMQYIKNRDIGFQKNHVLTIYLSNSNLMKSYLLLKNELVKLAEVDKVSACNSIPVQMGNSTSNIRWKGKDTTQQVLFSFTMVDFDYIEVFKMKMIEGRSFSKDYPTDSSAVILNEKAVKTIGLKSIVGEQITVWGQKAKVIGIVKDFNFMHLSQTIEPLYILCSNKYTSQVVVSLKNEKDIEALKKIEKVWKKINPDYPMDYQYVSNAYNYSFRLDSRINDIVKSFTILAIFISCLGLLALASFMAEQKAKSMVIRKIHGASILQIIILMSKEFIKWVLIAALIACPIAYLIVSMIYQNYQYHTEISVSIFITAGLATILIALLTVFYQALKTARQNPVEILKYE